MNYIQDTQAQIDNDKEVLRDIVGEMSNQERREVIKSKFQNIYSSAQKLCPGKTDSRSLYLGNLWITLSSLPPYNGGKMIAFKDRHNYSEPKTTPQTNYYFSVALNPESHEYEIRWQGNHKITSANTKIDEEILNGLSEAEKILEKATTEGSDY